jgi:uncharacterized protein
MPRCRVVFDFAVLAFFVAYCSLALALEVPPLRGRVNDYARLLPVESARKLETRLASFEQETGHQVAVLTIPTLEGEALENFSIRVAETWKIGRKGFDNGAILLVVANDRKIRWEVGYGLEGVLPDAIASRIIREIIVPQFRSKDYSGGILAGVEAVLKTIQGEPLPSSTRQKPASETWGLNTFIILLFLIPLFLGAYEFYPKRRRFGPWTVHGRGRHPIDWSGIPTGGGFGGGYSGGGFSGGGGGFGGGGASGSW